MAINFNMGNHIRYGTNKDNTTNVSNRFNGKISAGIIPASNYDVGVRQPEPVIPIQPIIPPLPINPSPQMLLPILGVGVIGGLIYGIMQMFKGNNVSNNIPNNEPNNIQGKPINTIIQPEQINGDGRIKLEKPKFPNLHTITPMGHDFIFDNGSSKIKNPNAFQDKMSTNLDNLIDNLLNDNNKKIKDLKQDFNITNDKSIQELTFGIGISNEQNLMTGGDEKLFNDRKNAIKKEIKNYLVNKKGLNEKLADKIVDKIKFKKEQPLLNGSLGGKNSSSDRGVYIHQTTRNKEQFVGVMKNKGMPSDDPIENKQDIENMKEYQQNLKKYEAQKDNSQDTEKDNSQDNEKYNGNDNSKDNDKKK